MLKITDKIRKFIMITLNLAKFILIFGGIFCWMFFVCGIDNDGDVGRFFITGMFMSILAIIVGILCEIIVVVFLLKKNERLTTLFDFSIYGNKKITPIVQTVYEEDIECEDEEYVYR